MHKPHCEPMNLNCFVVFENFVFGGLSGLVFQSRETIAVFYSKLYNYSFVVLDVTVREWRHSNVERQVQKVV